MMARTMMKSQTNEDPTILETMLKIHALELIVSQCSTAQNWNSCPVYSPTIKKYKFFRNKPT